MEGALQVMALVCVAARIKENDMEYLPIIGFI
jgi:hypothetical protein